MQGVLIVSADPRVSHSLRAILQPSGVVYLRRTAAEALGLVMGHWFDVILVDEPLPDGPAEELVRRLHALGYGPRTVPLLTATEHVEAFQRLGVQFWLAKPFGPEQVLDVVSRIEASAPAPGRVDETGAEPGVPAARPATVSAFATELQPLARRLWRAVARRPTDRQQLFEAFADALEQLLDADTVVVLAPPPGVSDLRLVAGEVATEEREQFLIRAGDAFIGALVRLNQPLAVAAGDWPEGHSALAARQLASRLGVSVLVPVVSRGDLLALVGTSKSRRFPGFTEQAAVLRLCASFLAGALESSQSLTDMTVASRTLECLTDALPFGLLLVTGTGVIRRANAAAAAGLGVSAADLQGAQLEQVGVDLARAWRDQVAALAAGAGPSVSQAGVEVLAVASDGRASEGYVLMLPGVPSCAQPLTPPARPTAGNELLHDMAKAIAHNFRNALVPVKTCAQLLPERYADEGFRESLFALTQDSVTRLDEWLEEILLFSELESHLLQTAEFPLEAAAEAGCSRALALFPDLQVTVAREFDPSARVRGNRELWAEAFYQIVRNACDAMVGVETPRLLLRTCRERDRVRAVVLDNGSGLDQTAQGSLFRPFCTTKLTGLGLGLALAQKVVRAYGGRIEVQPGRDGGCRVEVDVPAGDGPARPPRPA